MGRPDAFQLFCRYHLGLDSEFRSKHFNLNAVARDFQVLPETIKVLLDEFHMSPQVCAHVDYSLAKASADAMMVALKGDRGATEAFAHQCFREFRQALERYDPKRTFDGIDYDDIWGDEKD
jgi:hypothetical protein